MLTIGELVADRHSQIAIAIPAKAGTQRRRDGGETPAVATDHLTALPAGSGRQLPVRHLVRSDVAKPKHILPTVSGLRARRGAEGCASPFTVTLRKAISAP